MIEQIQQFTFPAAFALLPPAMDTAAARAMLLAIGRQESRFEHRRQVGGPARGFWQFELGGGVQGVMSHRATAGHVSRVLEALRYERLPGLVYDAIAHNDTLACVFARLLLWTVPAALPGPDDPDAGWAQYLSGWRPGKPHRETWDACYAEAWERVTREGEIHRG